MVPEIHWTYVTQMGLFTSGMDHILMQTQTYRKKKKYIKINLFLMLAFQRRTSFLTIICGLFQSHILPIFHFHHISGTYLGRVISQSMDIYSRSIIAKTIFTIWMSPSGIQNMGLQKPLCLNLSDDLNHSATTAG